MAIYTYKQFLKNNINESAGIPIINDNGLGVIVKYIGGEDGEFRITTPSGLVKVFYSDEFYTMPNNEDEIEKLKMLSTDILKMISNDDKQAKFDVVVSARKRELFDSDDSFFDDIVDDMQSKDNNISQKELKELARNADEYFSGAKSVDSLPSIHYYISEYLEDVLFYIAGKISAYLWWLENNDVKYNNMSARKIFSVYNKRIGHAARSTGWKVSDPKDAESDKMAVPGKTTYVLWSLTKHEWPENRKKHLHVGAIIDPLELIRMNGTETSELTVSLFDEDGEAMKGYDDIRIKDLGTVLNAFPKKDDSIDMDYDEKEDISEIDEKYFFSIFEEFRIETSDDVNEGLKDMIGKILGFLTGKSKKIKKLGEEYIRALTDRIDDTVELQANMKKIESKLGSAKAAERSPEYRKFKEKYTANRESHGRKIRRILDQLDKLALKNSTSKEQVDKVKVEAEKIEEERLNRKLHDLGV